MFQCFYTLSHFACLHHCLWGTCTSVGLDIPIVESVCVGGDCICHVRNSGKDRLRIPFNKNILDARPFLWSWQIRSVCLSCFLPLGIQLLHKHLCSLLNSHVVGGQKQLLCIVLWLTHMCRGMWVHICTCINKRNKNVKIWTKETLGINGLFWLTVTGHHGREDITIDTEATRSRCRKPPGVGAGRPQLQEQEAPQV